MLDHAQLVYWDDFKEPTKILRIRGVEYIGRAEDFNALRVTSIVVSFDETSNWRIITLGDMYARPIMRLISQGEWGDMGYIFISESDDVIFRGSTTCTTCD